MTSVLLRVQAAWKAMEQLADEGLVLSIGLQDADIGDVTAVMEYARITPAVNSLEVHPGNRNDALLAFCKSQVSASPDHHDIRRAPPRRRKIPACRRSGPPRSTLIATCSQMHGLLCAPVVLRC